MSQEKGVLTPNSKFLRILNIPIHDSSDSLHLYLKFLDLPPEKSVRRSGNNS